jgi:predicted nucleotidyltransferase component of viral defense system
MPDLAASIRARLLNLAKANGEDFQYVLTRYGNERLLHRLSISRHANQFVLKGASLFSLWLGRPHRTTRDVDLLGFGAPELDRLEAIFGELCDLAVEDGLEFDRGSIRTFSIREDSIYHGLRTTMRCALAKARIDLQVDVGFGDSVTPEPRLVEIPTLLDLPQPSLRAYAMETSIAEKLEAMVTLGMTNSRMKDYFDIWYLSERFPFDRTLAEAARATFARRGTELPSRIPVALTDEFITDRVNQTQWRAFLRKARVSERPTLEEVVVALRRFLGPVFKPGDHTETWEPGGPWSQKTRDIMESDR